MYAIRSYYVADDQVANATLEFVQPLADPALQCPDRQGAEQRQHGHQCQETGHQQAIALMQQLTRLPGFQDQRGLAVQIGQKPKTPQFIGTGESYNFV